MSSPAADRCSRARCSASSVGRPPRARSVSNTPSPSWKPRSNTDRWRPSAGQELAVDPDVAGVPPSAHATSSPPIAPSGPRALATVSSHSAAGSLRQVIPPPTWRRQPSPVGDERADQDARLHRAVRPDPAERPGVRPAPDRLEALEDLHRPDLRRAGDRAAGEARGEQVERVAARRQPARHRRDEVLDGGGPLEPAQPRDADRAGLADAAEVVAQDVDDHHVLGAVLGAGEQLAREAPGPRARSRPRGRVPLIGSVATTPVRVDARGTARARPTGARAAAGLGRRPRSR